MRWWQTTLPVEKFGDRSFLCRWIVVQLMIRYARRGILSKRKLYGSSTKSEELRTAGASGTAGISTGTPRFEGIEGWLVSTGADPCCVCTIQQYCVPRETVVSEKVSTLLLVVPTFV